MSKNDKVCALNDDVLARVAQIVQEAILTGIDCVDIMRQMRLHEVEPGRLSLTPEYVKSVKDGHERMMEQLPDLMEAKYGASDELRSSER